MPGWRDRGGDRGRRPPGSHTLGAARHLPRGSTESPGRSRARAADPPWPRGLPAPVPPLPHPIGKAPGAPLRLRPPPAAGTAGPLPAHVVVPPPREPPRPPRVTARPAASRRRLPAGGCRRGGSARAGLRRPPALAERPRPRRRRPRPRRRRRRAPLRPAAPPSWRLRSQRGHCRARHVTAARSALQLPAATAPPRPAPPRAGQAGSAPLRRRRRAKGRTPACGDARPPRGGAGGHLEGGQALELRRHLCGGRGRGRPAPPCAARWAGRSRASLAGSAPAGRGGRAFSRGAGGARPAAGPAAHVGAAASAVPAGWQGPSACPPGSRGRSRCRSSAGPRLAGPRPWACPATGRALALRASRSQTSTGAMRTRGGRGGMGEKNPKQNLSGVTGRMGTVSRLARAWDGTGFQVIPCVWACAALQSWHTENGLEDARVWRKPNSAHLTQLRCSPAPPGGAEDAGVRGSWPGSVLALPVQ